MRMTFRSSVALLAALWLAAPAWAAGERSGEKSGRVVLLDTGRYHLGDGVFNRYAADGELLAQKVAGWKYSFPFSLGRDGVVSIVIGKVIGVDTGSTLQIYFGLKAGGTVYVERIEEARVAERTKVGLLEPRHNHASFQSEPVHLKGGTYLVTVESNPYTMFDRDDIQIERLAVMTDVLDLAIEPLWARGKVYSGNLDLSLIPKAPRREELSVEVTAPARPGEEPSLPAPSARHRSAEGLELELEVKGREESTQ